MIIAKHILSGTREGFSDVLSGVPVQYEMITGPFKGALQVSRCVLALAKHKRIFSARTSGRIFTVDRFNVYRLTHLIILTL